MKNKVYLSTRPPIEEAESKRKLVFSFFNLHNIWWLRDKKYREITSKKCFRIFPDGRMLSRILFTKQERGHQFTKDMFSLNNSKNKKHFILGLDKEDVNKASRIIGIDRKKIIPYHSSITKNPDIFILPEGELLNICSLISKEKPDFIWIGISSPKQEFMADQIYQKTKTKKIFCVGAGLDFLLQRKKEANRIWQVIGIEWLYRLITDFDHSKIKVVRHFIAFFEIVTRKYHVVKR